MKIEEAYMHIVAQELEEGKLKTAIAAGTLAAASVMGIKHLTQQEPSHAPTIQQTSQMVKKKPITDREKLSQMVTDRFKVPSDKASHIVDMAIKHAKPTFPQAHHILAIAAIESEFNEKAKSKLKFDPAVGMMQIRPKVTGISPKELKTIEGQIKHGANLLHELHTKTGDIDTSVKAYNVGLTNVKNGKLQDSAYRYITKFKKEIKNYFE
jgi:Transglycosylase SLT domain